MQTTFQSQRLAYKAGQVKQSKLQVAGRRQIRAWSDEGESSTVVLDDKVQSVADTICALTLQEAADLTKYLEDKLGVSPMAAPMMGGPMMMMAGAAGGDGAEAAPEPEEQTEFTVKLASYDDKSKIKVIKELRGVVDGLGMKEAKEMVEKSPSVVRENVPKEIAEDIKARLEAAGAKCEIE